MWLATVDMTPSGARPPLKLTGTHEGGDTEAPDEEVDKLDDSGEFEQVESVTIVCTLDADVGTTTPPTE